MGMKWYFAINEAGCKGAVGLHAKLAVRSAKERTDLVPHMLYSGPRNEFTAWMEAHSVKVIDTDVPFKDFILDLDAQGKYSATFLGHWLRTSICGVEHDDEYILYTDCDVVFLSNPKLSRFRPAKFSCAPEFTPDNWNYFNSGVMVMNTVGLREDYDDFVVFIKKAIIEKGNSIRDQYAHNVYYRGRWDRLDLKLNWKPYWGPNPDAVIMHYHGPKIGAVLSIIRGKWNWASHHGKQIGSLFAGHLDGYRSALESTLSAIGLEPGVERKEVELAVAGAATYVPTEEVDLAFMNFRLFGD